MPPATGMRLPIVIRTRLVPSVAPAERGDRRGGEVRRPRLPGRRPRPRIGGLEAHGVVRERSAGRSSRARGGRRPRCGPRNRQTLIFAGRALDHAAPRTARGSPRATGARRARRPGSRASRGARARRRATRPAQRERPRHRLAPVRERLLRPARAARDPAPGAGARARPARCRRSARGGRPCAPPPRSTRTSQASCASTDGHAVGGRPGLGGEPLADLLLHHRDPARHAGQLLDRAQDRAGGDAVGQVRDDLRRRRVQRARGRGRIASARCSVVFGWASSASRSAGSSERSSSTTWTCAQRAARCSLSTPRPPPISSTTSPGASSAARSMTPRMFESIRKFWPRSRLGRTPNCLQAPQARLGRAGRSPPEQGGGVRSTCCVELRVARSRAPRATKRAVCSTNAGWLRSLRTSCGVR